MENVPLNEMLLFKPPPPLPSPPPHPPMHPLWTMARRHKVMPSLDGQRTAEAAASPARMNHAG